LENPVSKLFRTFPEIFDPKTGFFDPKTGNYFQTFFAKFSRVKKTVISKKKSEL